MKEGVKLLEGGGGKFNLISSDGVEGGVRVLRRFQQAAASRGASLRAVATSAVREARNGGWPTAARIHYYIPTSLQRGGAAQHFVRVCVRDCIS